MIQILVSSSCPCFHIFSQHISYILTKNNISNKINIDLINELSNEDEIFVFWNNISLPQSKIKRLIIYNLDTPFIENVRRELNAFILNAKNLTNNILIANFSSNNYDKDFFEKYENINYTILRYGYSDFHEKIYSMRKSEENIKDIDVLFFGAGTPYRNNKLKIIRDYCNLNNFNFVHVSNIYNEIEKADLVSRSKIILSIPSSEYVKIAGTNDLCRLSFLISNKAFILFEKLSGDTEVELENYGLVCCDNTEDLCEKIKYYISTSDEEKELMVNKLYKNFSENYNFEEAVCKIFM